LGEGQPGKQADECDQGREEIFVHATGKSGSHACYASNL
jgi:hypothetical protein